MIGQVTESDRTRVIVDFTRLAPTNQGDLFATLGVNTTLELYESSQVQIARIVSKHPIVESSASVLSSDATSITIKGTGFDATVATNNDVMFIQNKSAETTSITGFVGKISLTHMVFSFYTLGVNNIGVANVSLIVSQTHVAEEVSVATIVAREPSVIPCDTEGQDGPCYGSSDDDIIIEGKGFYAGKNTSECQQIYSSAKNKVDISPSDSTQPDVSATVINCSRTRLVGRWDSPPSACNSGFMTAMVTIDGTSTLAPEKVVWLLSSNFVAEVAVNEASDTYVVFFLYCFFFFFSLSIFSRAHVHERSIHLTHPQTYKKQILEHD